MQLLYTDPAQLPEGINGGAPMNNATGSPALDRYLNRIDVWAIAFGCMVGWGVFAMPGTTFLPVAGPAGTVISMLIGMGIMLLIGNNFSYLMGRTSITGGVYSYTKEAFGREIYEEIGAKIDYEKAELIEVVNFKMDKEKKDGSVFRDRAFANVFGYLIDNTITFNMDKEEVIGIVKVNAKEALDLFKTENGKIDAEIINLDNTINKRQVDFKEFLVNKGETALGKYGNVLKFVMEKTK